MTELVEDLEEKRARHNADAERHKRLRDELNDKTKEWAERRDELNAKVRGLIDEANQRRENRDKLNSEVRRPRETNGTTSSTISLRSPWPSDGRRCPRVASP